VLTVRDSENVDASFPCTRTSSVCSTRCGTLELDFDSIVESRYFPGLSTRLKGQREMTVDKEAERTHVRSIEPGIGNFNLISSLVDDLFENTVLVAKRVSPNGEIGRTGRIHITSGLESSERMSSILLTRRRCRTHEST